MFEIFKTLLFSSVPGTAIILFLLAAKPFVSKRLSARWQYYLWLVAAVCMIVPFWKAVPGQEARKVVYEEVQTVQPQERATQPTEPQAHGDVTDTIPIKYKKIPFGSAGGLRVYDLIAYVWAFGAGIFMVLALGNYYTFLFKKRRSSMELTSNSAFEEAKKELGVRRRIRVRISNDTASPMLVGTFFPIIYIPQNGIGEDAEKMVFLHELTHYKHGDLIYKWFALAVNAVCWFNPLAYLLSANISQACEVFCDMSVVGEMSEESKTLYMKTILLLAEKGGKKNV